MLYRFYSAFPRGSAGVGLLMLRVLIGSIAILQGVAYMTQVRPTVWMRVIGLLAMLSGALLLAGCLTPIFSSIICLGTTAIGLSWLPAADPNLFNGTLPTIVVAVVSAAIVLVGPGALSVDARLFGLREIVVARIPSTKT